MNRAMRAVFENEVRAEGEVASWPWETAPFVAFDHGGAALATRHPRDALNLASCGVFLLSLSRVYCTRMPAFNT